MSLASRLAPQEYLQTCNPDGEQASSIERIQRLERLEQERLEEKVRKEERRRQQIAGAKPSGGRHDLVEDIERVTKYPMAVLGIAWLVIAIVILSTDLTARPRPVLVGALFVLWAVLLVEYSCAWWSLPTVAAISGGVGWSRRPWWCHLSRAGTSSGWRR